ncbi:hypothetical protein IWX91DRAFT_339987 [Phyllosticta citricarpa]
MAGKKQKSRMISVRLVSMAMTGFYRTFVRPRTKRPLSFIKYDPVGKFASTRPSLLVYGGGMEGWGGGRESRGGKELGQWG